MRKFLELFYLRSPLLLPMVFVVVLLVFFVIRLKATLYASELNEENRSYYFNARSARLYVASPLEASFLDNSEDLWPGLFNSKRPPGPEDIPQLYSAARKMPELKIEGQDLERARSWSVLAQSGHIESLKIELQDLLRQAPDTSKLTCAAFDQEFAFRLTQAKLKTQEQTRPYFQRCQNMTVLLWWDLEDAIQNKNEAKAQKLAAFFQQQIKEEDIRKDDSKGAYTRWLALEGYSLAHVYSGAAVNVKKD